jgi:putative membrane protein insertion efficiency factor
MNNSSSTSAKPWTAPVPSTNPSVGARVLVGVITLYQRLTAGRVAPCRFYPSCSHYAREAIEVHGLWRGSGLALRRLGRCRPLGPHGIDLVPVSRSVGSDRS